MYVLDFSVASLMWPDLFALQVYFTVISASINMNLVQNGLVTDTDFF